jgi:hypothetical protein
MATADRSRRRAAKFVVRPAKPIEIVTVLVLIATTGYAFDCVSNPSPCEAYANADAVFIGKVVRIVPESIPGMSTRDDDYDQIAYVVVEETYKGLRRSSILLHQLGRTHAPKFVLGSRYLFYANRDSLGRHWSVRPCGRTRMANYVQDDLRYLRALPSSGKTTRIAGEIVKYEADSENPAGATERMEGITVRVLGLSKAYTTTTDANGVYEILNVPPGKYRIEPTIPAGFRLWAAMHYGRFNLDNIQSLEIDLQPDGCSGLTILLTTSAVPARKDRKIGN